MKQTLRTIGLMSLVLLPYVAQAAVTITGASDGSGGTFFGISFGGGGGSRNGVSCMGTICRISQEIINYINGVLVPLLFGVAFITFLYGVAKAYIFSSGEPKAVAEGHWLALWGLVGFAVMISVWGLVNIVSNTFGLAGYVAPPLPTSF